MRAWITAPALGLLAACAPGLLSAGEWDPPSRQREAAPPPAYAPPAAKEYAAPAEAAPAPRLSRRFLDLVHELQVRQSDVQAQTQALLALGGPAISQATRNQFEAARFAKTRADKAWRRLSREGRGLDAGAIAADSNYDRELDEVVGWLGDAQQEQQALVGAAFAETAHLPAARNQIEAVKFAQTRARKAYQGLARSARYE